MRFIHILLGSADPTSVNGVNKVVHWLATSQVRAGIASEVWALKQDGAESSHDHEYPLRVFRTTRSRFLLARDLLTAINNLIPQDTWVQLHSVFIPELRAIASVLKRRGILYGVTTHGGYLSFYADRSLAMRTKKAAFSALWENWMLRNAAMIHVIGATEIDDLKRRANKQKIVLIPNGYEVDPREPELTPRQEGKPPAIIFCGRHVIKQKGLDLLLMGFAKYRAQGGTLRLIMIGGGKDHEYLRQLAKDLGINNAISWPGILTVEDLRSSVGSAAAFVHSSRFDVLPTACLEAAALGVPLFVSEETCFAPYLEPRNAGWVCRPNAPDKIAETMFIIQRTTPAERHAMGERARRMILEELRWDFICKKLYQAVQGCMARAA